MSRCFYKQEGSKEGFATKKAKDTKGHEEARILGASRDSILHLCAAREAENRRNSVRTKRNYPSSWSFVALGLLRGKTLLTVVRAVGALPRQVLPIGVSAMS